MIPYNLSCGNVNAAGNWEPDGYWTATGSTSVFNTTNNVDTSLISNPAPQAVYQNLRSGANFQYNLVGSLPGNSYAVTLQFMEPTATASGQRLENIAVNGSTILSNFDIYNLAGAQYRAVAKSFNATADSTGAITIQFTTALGSVLPAAISAITATPGTVNQNPGFTGVGFSRTVSVTQGSNASSSVTVASLAGFNSAASLSVSNLPSGVTAAFSSNPVTPPANGNATSTLTFTASSSATPGTRTVAVTVHPARSSRPATLP